MYGDPAIKEGFYLIEYNKFIYDDGFHESKDEQCIDRLLTFLDLICDLYFQGVISKHEISFFEYELTKIYRNPYILKYLKEVAEGRLELGFQNKPAFSFIRYCEQHPITKDIQFDDILIITQEDILKYAADMKDRGKRQ